MPTGASTPPTDNIPSEMLWLLGMAVAVVLLQVVVKGLLGVVMVVDMRLLVVVSLLEVAMDKNKST